MRWQHQFCDFLFRKLPKIGLRKTRAVKRGRYAVQGRHVVRSCYRARAETPERMVVVIFRYLNFALWIERSVAFGPPGCRGQPLRTTEMTELGVPSELWSGP